MSAANIKDVERYLLSGERIVVAVRRHWATLAEPAGTAVVGFLVAAALALRVDDRFGQVSDLVWWLWFALVARLVFYVYEWRHEWFVATDRRLLLIYGFIIRKVDMMPLKKVTDMTYDRSILGRLLGYGTFVLESAGQDQALSRVGFVPPPDETYALIVGQIFYRDGDETDPPADDADEDDLPVSGTNGQEDDPTRRLAWPRSRGRTQRTRRGTHRSGSEDDTESLFLDDLSAQSRGSTLYSSSQTHKGPVDEYRPDTTGWWHR